MSDDEASKASSESTKTGKISKLYRCRYCGEVKNRHNCAKKPVMVEIDDMSTQTDLFVTGSSRVVTILVTRHLQNITGTPLMSTQSRKDDEPMSKRFKPMEREIFTEDSTTFGGSSENSTTNLLEDDVPLDLLFEDLDDPREVSFLNGIA